MRHTLTLYGKPDCDLCHAARELLLRLQREFDFRLHEVDITDNGELEASYRYDIPVVTIDEQLQLKAPILERELRAALQ